jgi:hypothetical protein
MILLFPEHYEEVDAPEVSANI